MKHNTSKLTIAALAGLFTAGTATACVLGDPAGQAAGTQSGVVAEKDKCSGKDGCKGKEDCKGEDKCSGKDGCKGKDAAAQSIL